MHRRSNSRFASYPCMGRSASKLSNTRSGVVSVNRLPFRILHRFTLSLAAPIPPLALLHGKPRVTRLRHRRAKNVEAANVLVLRSHAAQLLIESIRILPRQLRHAAYPQDFKIAQHGRTDGNQISKGTGIRSHKISLTSNFDAGTFI